ncbi:MAG: DUF3038 domain-containing protein [Spirulinaceae cyanobacterium RM2_2_10]|nr:DUF3038 domain-containing protein [Spirulinaceae cyanobacterium RM2_2_10]
MYPTAPSASSAPQLQDLTLVKAPDAGQLDNIKAHLDLVLLAIEALTGLGSEAMLAAAATLKVEGAVGDRVALWRLRQSNPHRKSSGGRKKLDVEEARALVLIVCHLAQKHQELIRRAVTLLEEMTGQGREPHQAALLGDYLDTFSNTYQERMEASATVTSEMLKQLAFKLLIDLLFYSAANGHRRFWLALLDRAQ